MKSLFPRIHRALKGSGGEMAFLRGSCDGMGAILGAQEHRRETLICDVFLVKFHDVKCERTPTGSGDQSALF